MSNLYDALDRSTTFNKFKVDDLLFVEYTCEPGGPQAEIWSHCNYFTYVVSGSMTLKTANREFHITQGESYFIRRGAFIIPEFFEEVFCDMIIFTPDDFICQVIEKYQIELPDRSSMGSDLFPVQPLHLNRSLVAYYQSLFSYFKGPEPPSPILLRHKFEELILNILTHGNNPRIIDICAGLQRSNYPSLQLIMEEHFNARLTLTEFARLTARSLSTFRRDFQEAYGTSPGAWLREKRLLYSRHLLKVKSGTIDDIAYASGFRSRTHFTRAFKDRFGLPPHRFRQHQN